MPRDKITRAVEALAGLNYMEWRAVADDVERRFEQKRNRLTLSSDDADEIACRIQRERPGLGS